MATSKKTTKKKAPAKKAEPKKAEPKKAAPKAPAILAMPDYSGMARHIICEQGWSNSPAPDAPLQRCLTTCQPRTDTANLLVAATGDLADCGPGDRCARHRSGERHTRALTKGIGPDGDGRARRGH